MLFALVKSVIGRSKRPLAALILVVITGCGDFFAQRETRQKSHQIINELRQIKENPSVTNPLPQLYRQPPELIEVADGIKLIYYCKNHSADQLAKLVGTQFPYKLSPNAATNQLVVHCPGKQEVEQILKLLHSIDVPPIQVNIDCLILERFADVTMDWETSLQIDNLFGERITLGGEFPGASLREARRSDFGLDIGYWNQKLSPTEFRFAVDMLVSRGYLKVLMNPSLETLNGQEATITSRDYTRTVKIVTPPGVTAYNLTEYQWVEDKLTVTPYVYADGSIGLNTEIMLGSTKPEGVIQTPIITERFVKSKETRIEPGHSLVIGGMRKSEERSVVRGVPFLQDIPILGILFSSKDFEEQALEVIFVLTPSISNGGIEYAEMVEGLHQARSRGQFKASLQKTITDPFGFGDSTSKTEKKTEQTKLERLKSEIDEAEANGQIDEKKQALIDFADQLISEMEEMLKSKP